MSSKFKEPVRGKRIIGNKAVIAIGTASKTHQIAIHVVEAITDLPKSSRPSISKKNFININVVGPAYNPIFLKLITK